MHWHAHERPGCSCLIANIAQQDRLASGEDIFGPLIRKHLLHNNHRVAVEVLPDAELARQQEAAEQAKLDARRSAMSHADVAAAVEETQRLRLRQVCCIPEVAMLWAFALADGVGKQPVALARVASLNAAATTSAQLMGVDAVSRKVFEVCTFPTG